MKTMLIYLWLSVTIAVTAQTTQKAIIVDGIPTNLTEENWKTSIPASDIDTVFEIKPKIAIEKYGEYIGNDGLLMIKSKTANAVTKNNIERAVYGDKNPVVIVNGSQIEYKAMNDIDITQIEYIQHLKKIDEIDFKKYGPQALNGIVLIKLKTE